MISETFVTGLNQKLSTFSLVSFSGEAKNNNKLDPITPDRKLKFNMKKDVYKNRITLNLGKVHTKTSFSTMRNNVLNFGLLCTKTKKNDWWKKNNFAGIIKTARVLGLKILSIMEEWIQLK